MNPSMSNVISELAEHEKLLMTELQELTAKCRSVSDQLAQVQTALSALRGTSLTKQAKPDRAAKRNMATVTVLEEHIMTILGKEGRLPLATLTSQIKSRLLAEGQSRVGLKPLLAKAIESPKLKIDENQVVMLVSNSVTRD